MILILNYVLGSIRTLKFFGPLSVESWDRRVGSIEVRARVNHCSALATNWIILSKCRAEDSLNPLLSSSHCSNLIFIPPFFASGSRFSSTMEALISQFTFLSDRALQDKNFDPSTIEDLMKLFEIEAYNSWAAMELQHQNEVRDAEIAMQQAEDYLDSVMEDAMDEFRRFEEEFDRMAEAELQDLVDKSEKARKMGRLMEKAAAVASKRYMEAAMNSATASMRSAWKAISSNKVHPS
ncbi:uncharacterized protein LOC111795549 isoform X2 [Cucurbita pepo subsp. pepo]|uniref:uncharacterized protein LOC111795549 isoform X2 n=1 Tax=Cucurbita pepo subsp. pepo TaxID=3664 RepID=UPI000C9D7AB4|nr:uncharacterized protein LOC111795549 isoform X2 [Cucurbita pepo subsp. pepo]